MCKDRGFWEVLEPIKDLYDNRDGYSYIRVAFREPQSEKQPLEENTQNYIQKNHTYLFCTIKLIVIQKDFTEIVMNKFMVEVYVEVLTGVFQNPEGAENFIKQRTEEICE